MGVQKVSIIVPVYNVERYLDKCLESILQQTYPNLEVLLVDDGSIDGSGRICDDWAAAHSCFRVIHKINGGLSDARNTGLDAATGEYVAFVDSDDYIAPDMLQKLYEAMSVSNAEMGICNFLNVDEHGVPISELNWNLPIRDEVISGFDAITKMHIPVKRGWLGWYYSVACNKLYRKVLFSDVRFPVGKLCEDVFVAHRLLGKCEKVACISDVGYYYVQRAGSIVHSKTPKTNLHDAEGYLDRALYCFEHGLYRPAGHAYGRAAMLLPDADPGRENQQELLSEYHDALRCFRQNIRFRKYCTLKEAIQVSIVFLSPNLYRIVFRNPVWQTIKTVFSSTAGGKTHE